MTEDQPKRVLKIILIGTLFQERHFNRTMKVLAEMEANEAKVVQKIEEDKQQILRETEEIRKKMRFLEEEERKLDMEILQTKRHKPNPPAASPITFGNPAAMISPSPSLTYPQFGGGMAMMMFSTPGPATAAKRTGSRTSDLGSGSKKYRHHHQQHQAPSKVADKFGINFF